MTTTTSVGDYDDKAKIAEVIAKHQPKTKEFNPLQNSIQTNLVMDKTLENYVHQIKTNIHIGTKAMYFVARDVFDAKSNLKNEDYIRLVLKFKWNGSTQSKMLAIGGSIKLFTVYKEGKLPNAWTTLYELTQLSDDQFDSIKSMLTQDVTWTAIAKKLGKKNIPDISWLLNFLNLEVDKREVSSVAEFTNTLTQIKKDLKKYPAIKIADVVDKKGVSKTKKVEKSITRYLNSLKTKTDKEVKKRENKRKDKEIQTQVAA